MIRSWRARSIRADVDHAEQLSDSVGDIGAWQLARFNELWRSTKVNTPRFREWAGDKLPDAFESWDQFASCIPLCRRCDIQTFKTQLYDQSCEHDFFRSTGGTTATPIQVPGIHYESHVASTALWQARRWLGIQPQDKLFLLWGHAHLLGTGFNGWLRKRKRIIADRVLGYCRYSAYDLSESAMRDAARALIRFRPGWVLGYSVALHRLATFNSELASDLRALRLKAIVATAESFPSPDSRAIIEKLFECPVAMEYGTVETGPIACEATAGDYRCFWQNYFIETIDNHDQANQRDIVITALFRRAMPLLRYHVGDQICGKDWAPPITRFQHVLGRSNDYIDLPNGKKIHSEAFAHVVRDFPEILGYQVIQSVTSIDICVQINQPLSPDSLVAITNRLIKIDPNLANCKISEVSELKKTIAGKTPAILKL